jgi:hypothetical protein
MTPLMPAREEPPEILARRSVRPPTILHLHLQEEAMRLIGRHLRNLALAVRVSAVAVVVADTLAVPASPAPSASRRRCTR